MSDISKTGVKFEDRMDRPIPEPFYLDLPTPLTLDLPPPKKPHITSDSPHEIPHERYDPKEILKLIEDSFFTPERKVRKTPRQFIVENTLVPNSPKWNRYYKYQEAIKHGRKLTREQIIDWTKMWVEVHPKEATASKLKNYQKTIKERKIQETSRKLDCVINGIGNTIQEIRHQDRKIQEINLRAKNDSILKRLQSKQPISNPWYSETKH